MDARGVPQRKIVDLRGSNAVHLPVLLGLTTQDATLLAAVIAAVAAVIKLIADALSARGTAMRAAHRTALEPHLASLGKGIHEIMAGVVLVHRRVQKGQAPGNALVHAERAAQELKGRRLEVKYELGGTEEALRVLTRAPNWIATYRGDASGLALVEQMQKLSRRLDDTIARSYRRGRPPTWPERKWLGRAAREVRETWKRRSERRACSE